MSILPNPQTINDKMGKRTVREIKGELFWTFLRGEKQEIRKLLSKDGKYTPSNYEMNTIRGYKYIYDGGKTVQIGIRLGYNTNRKSENYLFQFESPKDNVVPIK